MKLLYLSQNYVNFELRNLQKCNIFILIGPITEWPKTNILGLWGLHVSNLILNSDREIKW